MIDEDGKFWKPLNRAALVEGISDAMLNREDNDASWDDLAEVVVQYLEQASIRVPRDDKLPAQFRNPDHTEEPEGWSPIQRVIEDGSISFSEVREQQAVTAYLDRRRQDAVVQYLRLSGSRMPSGNTGNRYSFFRPGT